MTSSEYRQYITSIEWREKSKRCRALNKHRCTVFPWMQANHAHHLTYRNMKSELPVRDIVALSAIAHKIVHLPLFFKVKSMRIFSNWFLRVAYVFSVVFWNLIGILGEK